MQKTFNAYEKATIKNTAREVARLVTKQEKLRTQIEELTKKVEAQIQEIDETITQYEANIQNITGGYAASELCEKVSRGSQNDWVFKYPDTIVPPVQEETKEEEKREEKEEKVEQNEHLYKEEVTLKVPQEETISGPENVFDDDPFNSAKQSDDDDFFNDDEFK